MTCANIGEWNQMDRKMYAKQATGSMELNSIQVVSNTKLKVFALLIVHIDVEVVKLKQAI